MKTKTQEPELLISSTVHMEQGSNGLPREKMVLAGKAEQTRRAVATVSSPQ